jgi:hypothetical protein
MCQSDSAKWDVQVMLSILAVIRHENIVYLFSRELTAKRTAYMKFEELNRDVLFARKGGPALCPICLIATDTSRFEDLRTAIAVSCLCYHSDKSLAYYAAAHGNLEAVQILYDTGYKICDAVCGAVRAGQSHVFNWLDLMVPDLVDEALQNPDLIVKGAKGGSVWIVRKLLERTAEIKDDAKNKSIIAAATRGYFELTKYLIGMFEPPSNILPNVVERNQTDIAKLLLQEPAIDPNAQCNGKTSLMIAIQVQNIESVSSLLSRSDLVLPDDDRALETSLDSLPELFSLFVASAKRDMNFQNSHGETLLHLAAVREKTEIGRIICGQKGGKTDLKDAVLIFFSKSFLFS